MFAHRQRRRGTRSALAVIVVSLAGVAGVRAAAPMFQGPTPSPRSSSSLTAPLISVEVVEPTVGVDPGSLGLVVAGADVMGSVSVVAIPNGYRMSYLPSAPFGYGERIGVTAQAADNVGVGSSYSWIFYIDTEFSTGTVIFDLGHGDSTADQIYDGYGLASWLAGQGYEVNWVIEQAKAYEGIDLAAVVDQTPNGNTPGPDGSVASRTYAGGPLLIPDPDQSTAYNEAWLEIDRLVAHFGYAPNIDEVQSPILVPRGNIMYVNRRAKIAAADDLAKTEMDLARIPYVDVVAPGTVGDPASVAGGGLFYGTNDLLCDRLRKYDLVIQGDYDWNTPNASELAAISELGAFIARAGMGIFEGASASIENTAHWVTEPPNPIVEGVVISPNFTPDSTRLGHPFLQTMSAIPIPGGAFPIWDVDLNRFRSNLQNILVDSGNGDIGYVFGAVGSGKTYFMGGQQRDDLADRRLLLNALIYNVIYPKYSREFQPPLVVTGIDNLVRVDIRVTGGSESVGNILEDRLDTLSTLVADSVDLLVPGSGYTWNPATRTLNFSLGDLNPVDYPSGVVGSYYVKVHPASEGYLAIVAHTTRYTDAWGAAYELDSTGCGAVRAGPHLEVQKTPSQVDVMVEQTTRIVLRLVARNNHVSNPLHDLLLTDQLPPGVTFVAGSVITAKGTADWGTTTASTLTWRVGILVPSEEAVLTFAVDITPASLGPLLVNDGASGSALDRFGLPMTASTADVHVNAHAVGDPVLDFTLTPGQAVAETATSFTFCARNIGHTKKFEKGQDEIVLEIPAAFGSPTSVTVPGAGWIWFWDATERALTLSNPAGDVNLATGQGVCSSFQLTTPSAPIGYQLPASGTIDSRRFAYSEGLLVDVLRNPSLDFRRSEVATAEACEVVTYAHAIENTSNGSDVYHISGTSSEGYLLAFYEDVDFDSRVSPSDTLLVDNDGDGDPDTNGIPAGGTMLLLVAVAVGDTPVDLVDITSVRVRSDAVTLVSIALTDTTTVRALSAAIVPRGPTAEVCQGRSIVLDATPGFDRYGWSTGELSPSITVSPTGDTNYVVIVTSINGCSTTAARTVTVNPNPQPVIVGNPGALCGCAWVHLDCGLSDCEWSVGGIGPTLDVEICADTTISVSVTDSNGCVGTDAVTILSSASTTADAGPDWSVFCAGTVVPLGIPAIPGATYAWTPTTGLDDPTAAQPLASPDVTTTYRVTMAFAAGCEATDETTIWRGSATPTVSMGNVLREVKSNAGTDVIHHYTEVASGTDFDVYRSTSKDQTVVALVGSSPLGAARVDDLGAVLDGRPVSFYQLSARNCTPQTGP